MAAELMLKQKYRNLNAYTTLTRALNAPYKAL